MKDAETKLMIADYFVNGLENYFLIQLENSHGHHWVNRTQLSSPSTQFVNNDINPNETTSRLRSNKNDTKCKM